METLNLKLESKTIECEVRKLRTKVIFEMGKPEIIIPKNLRKEAYELLIKELEKEINNDTI